MKKTFLLLAIMSLLNLFPRAQTGRVVLIEEFTETGCSACAEYDSAFQAITNAHSDKVVVVNYHCFYMLDPFYQYNKACDARYQAYQLEGYPCAMMNGKKPIASSAHQAYVTPERIKALYNQPLLFKIEINSSSTGKGDVHSADITVTAKSLVNNPSNDLRLYVFVNENHINYLQRYKQKSVNGVNDFNHILRAMLPGAEGTAIGSQTVGKENKIKASYVNDDKEVNYKQLEIVAFIQDQKTQEVLGAAVGSLLK